MFDQCTAWGGREKWGKEKVQFYGRMDKIRAAFILGHSLEHVLCL